MSGAERVDVLAVLDDLIADMGTTPGTTGALLAEARAAVAELIEAASDVAGELTRDPEPGTPLARLDAALARVGGA